MIEVFPNVKVVLLKSKGVLLEVKWDVFKVKADAVKRQSGVS